MAISFFFSFALEIIFSFLSTFTISLTALGFFSIFFGSIFTIFSTFFFSMAVFLGFSITGFFSILVIAGTSVFLTVSF
jgi:hypothetical protein